MKPENYSLGKGSGEMFMFTAGVHCWNTNLLSNDNALLYF